MGLVGDNDTLERLTVAQCPERAGGELALLLFSLSLHKS